MTSTKASFKKAQSPRDLARQRWLGVAWVYGGLLALGLVFISVIYVSFVTSLKTNPLEWPFTLGAPQFSPNNWLSAARLGREGDGNSWLGGFAPGADVQFSLTYFIPEGATEVPQIVIPERTSGSRLVALRAPVFAAEFATVTLTETAREMGKLEDRDETGNFVTYALRVQYDEAKGQARKSEKLPLDIETTRGYVLIASTLPPDRIERRGRVASWDSITPGAVGFTFKNYVRAFRESYDATTKQSLLWRWTINTFLFAFFRVIAALLFASMAGYALARLHFFAKRPLFFLILFSMMVPAQVTFISNYLVLRDGIFGVSKLFGVDTLLNTMAGLILGGSGSAALVAASAVFIMKQFFESMPNEIEEAARIDGANALQTFFRIVLPMATPALGALTILTFQGAWNDFFWPLVVMGSRENLTLPVGLLSFRTAYGPAGDWGLILSSAFFSMIPIVILFVIFQRYFIEGVSFSGVKG
jgi:multiple sugar transport system permease protein